VSVKAVVSMAGSCILLVPPGYYLQKAAKLEMMHTIHCVLDFSGKKWGFFGGDTNASKVRAKPSKTS
jgi:hypothetical protein